jgi:uncharacterized protein HemY
LYFGNMYGRNDPKQIGDALKSMIDGDRQLKYKLDALKSMADTATEAAKLAREQYQRVKAAAELLNPLPAVEALAAVDET